MDGLASPDKERAPSKLVRVSGEGYLRLNSKVSCSRDKNNRDRKLSILSRIYASIAKLVKATHCKCVIPGSNPGRCSNKNLKIIKFFDIIYIENK